jgi:patatin-like phospholipase/acyl hydrolase
MNKLNLNKNKKTIFICILIFVLLIILYNDRKKYVFGTDIPKAFIVINNEKHELIHGDANWQISLPGENVPGSSYIVDPKKELEKNCTFIEVTPNSQMSFDLKYEDYIQKAVLYSMDITNYSTTKKSEKVLNSPYTFKSPEEKGDYYYIFYVNWDTNHNVNYLFKIRVV